MAAFPALAAADPSPLVDSSVRSTSFDGTALPPGASFTTLNTGGTATVNLGTLTVDGARVDGQATPTLTAPQTLEFRATFDPTARFQHAGFGVTLSGGNDDGPSAIFTTGGGGGMSVVTHATVGGSEPSIPLPNTVNPAVPNTYRIEWAANAVSYYVNDTLIATQNVTITGAMRPVASDFDTGGGALTLDWLTLGQRSAAGTFDSRVLQADDPRTVWGSLTPTGSGTTSFKTRTGNTATPDSSWSGWQSTVGAAVQSPGGKYIQYEAVLDNAAANLDQVSIDYTIDTTGPAVTVNDPQVSGTSARVTFSSSAADLGRFECKVDGGAFATCSSPTDLTGLAVGSHTVSVRAFDKLGNEGSTASKSFTIAAPAQSGGGGGTQGAGNSTVDKTAPRVTFAATSLRASKRGTVGVKVGCPATETSCKITVQLMRGKTVAAKKTVTVKGGKTKTVTLQLTKTIRRQLSSHHSLKVTAVLSAKDAAGNQKTTKKSLTLRG
jgi:hypothetical protein